MGGSGFLRTPPESAAAQSLFDEDETELGYVMNVTRLWAYQPETVTALFGVMRQSISGADFNPRLRGILVAAAASAREDSYCSLAWGSKLAAAASPAVAASVIRSDDGELSGAERAMAAWVRTVVRDPNAATSDDIEGLRSAGFDDGQIFSMTVFAALRLAFSSVNDALGATPDVELRDGAPSEVVAAVDFGRAVG